MLAHRGRQRQPVVSVGVAVQPRAREQNDRGSSYAVFALSSQNGVLPGATPIRAVVVRIVGSRLPIRRWIWRPESGFPYSALAAARDCCWGSSGGAICQDRTRSLRLSMRDYRRGPGQACAWDHACGRRNRGLGSVASVGCKAGPGLGRAKRSFRRRLGRSCPRPHRLESRSLVRSRMWPRSGDSEGTGVVVKCGEAFPTLYPGKMKTHVCTFIFQRERGKRTLVTSPFHALS